MMKNYEEQMRGFVKLVGRSRDIGDGWRQVSDLIWNNSHMRECIFNDDLIERNEELKQVRLTEQGKGVLKYG